MQFWRLQFCNLTGEWCDTKVYSWLCKIPDEWVAGRLSIWVFENDKKRQSYPCLHYQSILLCDGDHICETCSFVLRDLPCAFVARSTSFLFFSLPTCKLGWWNSTGRVCDNLRLNILPLLIFTRRNIFDACYSALVTSWIKN